MLAIILFILRILFLLIFYIFIFKLTLAIFNDLRIFPISKSEANSTSIKNKPVGENSSGGALVVLASTDDGMHSGNTLSLNTRTEIGRAPDCDIRIEDDFVSSQHAVITYLNEQYWVEDLNSLNGTYVNEVKLQKSVVLANGDRLRVGGVSFEFVRWAYAVEPNNRSGAG